ncbi:MAG: hypothetical protein R2853_11180 [Thermomicrobiales bacterium]
MPSTRTVSEEAKRYGKLTVLPTKMNPDLSMGKELLKKTGAGNLFMVFGEPDVAITPQPDGRLVASIVGLDITTRPPATSARRRPATWTTTLRPGSSTRTTTARASSSATPTSRAATRPTTS